VRNFLRNNFLLLILLNSANVFNYFFQLLVGRVLTPEDFGSFNSLSSIAIILAAPAAVLPLVYSRYAVSLSLKSLEHIKGLLVSGLRNMTLLAGVLLLIGILAIPWIKTYLHLNATLPIVIMLVGLALSILCPVLLGVLQGLNRYWLFGLGSTSLSLGRFLFGLVLVLFLPLGVNGALLAGTLGVAITLIIGLWAVRDIMALKVESLTQATVRDMLRYSFPVFLTTAMVTILFNLDLVLVRHYCSPEEAGFYATAAIIGRIALFLPGTLVNVLFPEAAKNKDMGERNSNILWLNLALTLLLGGSVAFFFWFWPQEIIVFLFGEKYSEAAPLLRILSLGMAFLAIANSIFTYNLAHANYFYLWPLFFGVVVKVVLIILFHDSALVIAKIVLLAIVITILGTLIGLFLSQKQPKNLLQTP
jgi:O-antigen/teichoic acid export membrane protein